MRKNNLTKIGLLKVCASVGIIEMTIKNSKTEMVNALNNKYGCIKFTITKTSGGQTYEGKNTHKSFVEHSQIRNSMKRDDERKLECPCCHKEFNHKKFKSISGGYSKFCKDCRELKHGQ